MTWRGIRIVEHPLLDGLKMPVLRVRDEVPLPEPFRKEMNAWLLETFGEREIAVIINGSAYVSPRNMALITKTTHPKIGNR